MTGLTNETNMAAPEDEIHDEKLYVIPDRVLEEWDRLSDLSRDAEARAKRAETSEVGAHILIAAMVATWVGVAFGTAEGRPHRTDFWMYLLALQVAYVFLRFVFWPKR